MITISAAALRLGVPMARPGSLLVISLHLTVLLKVACSTASETLLIKSCVG